MWETVFSQNTFFLESISWRYIEGKSSQQTIKGEDLEPAPSDDLDLPLDDDRKMK